MSRAANPIRKQRRDERCHSVYEAIAQADTSLTATDLRYETLESEAAIRRALEALRDDGRVRRFRDPDDGRVFRYDTTGGESL